MMDLLLRYHPELPDSQIMKLVGTTKPTIQAIRDRTHWNSTNIKPVDPVSLSLCSQMDLDQAVRKAARRAAKMGKVTPTAETATLLPASESIAPQDEAPAGDEVTPAMFAPAEPQPAEPEPEVSESEAFKAFDQTPAEPSPEEEDVDADSVFAKLKELKPALEEDDASASEDAGDENPS